MAFIEALRGNDDLISPQRLPHAKRFRDISRWSAFSLATGLLFFAAFASIASGSKQHWVVPAFTAAVLLAWTWLTPHTRHALARHTLTPTVDEDGGVGFLPRIESCRSDSLVVATPFVIFERRIEWGIP